MKKLVTVLVCLAAIAVPTAASASVTIGSTLADPADNAFNCGANCTEIVTKLDAPKAAAGGVASTLDGVVTSWKIKVGAATSPVRFRIARLLDVAMAKWTGVGTGQTVTPPINTISTYDVRMPIKTGDYIGLDADGIVSSFHTLANPPTGVYQFFGSPTKPQLADGDPGRQPNGTNSPYEILMQATIEPDVDADGWGDETQDLCVGTAGGDKGCPVRSVSIADASITEGSSGRHDLTFTISLDGISASAASLHAETADASAKAPGDYSATSQDVTFAPGQTSATFNVPVAGDTVLEAGETFSVNLTGLTNLTGARTTATGTITNDDADTTPPTTKLTRVKVLAAAGSVKLRFSGADTGGGKVAFQCRIDKGKFKPCRSPKTYRHLKAGRHTVRVRARDAAGNVDVTPAKRSFRIAS